MHNVSAKRGREKNMKEKKAVNILWERTEIFTLYWVLLAYIFKWDLYSYPVFIVVANVLYLLWEFMRVEP